MVKKTLLVILILLLIAVVAFVVMFGDGGKWLQGALYNLRPIYRECRIEGKNYQSDKIDDCELFSGKLDAMAFPDGEYTIFAKYSDKRLPDNIIPIKISDKGTKLACTYLDNGYEPQIDVFTVNDTLSSQRLKTDQELPVNSQGSVVQINFVKNGQPYVYDTNICERAFEATIYDEEKNPLGTALMDHNGFINSRSLTNEILINTNPYYTDKTGKTEKNFQAGNIYASLNFAPDIMFKFTVPCSSEKASVYIPTLETQKDVIIPFQGLNDHYLKTCGSRLYISLQNTNRADDIQIFDNLDLDISEKMPSYLLRLSQIARVADQNAIFPISFKISLHLRDRSDSNEVTTLGTGLLTVNGYAPGSSTPPSTPGNDGPIRNNTASPDNSEIINDSNASPDNSTGNARPKVRRPVAN